MFFVRSLSPRHRAGARRVASTRPACALIAVVALGAALGTSTVAVHAAAIPFGTVLISGAQWAGADTGLGDLNVYSNGTQSQDQMGTFGLQYECTELAQRWAFYKFGEPAQWPISKAADMWTAGPTMPVPLSQNPNGGATPPQHGDILVFAATSSNPTGHVAVVSSVSATGVTAVHQNFTLNGTLAGQWTQPLSGTTVAALGNDPVIGWLRAGPAVAGPAPTLPVRASSAPSTAVTPDGSTQTVFWKGTSNQLTEAWYAGGAWHGPADFGQFGTLVSAPSVAISKDGLTQTVFWQGANGHLYEAWYAGSWHGPADLTATWGGLGGMTSAPSAVTTKDGSQLVFWRGPDNRLWEAWYAAGSWHGPSDLVSQGTMASAPNVAVTPDGTTQTVFWRGTNGLLTEAWFTGQWNGPQQFGNFGALASAPSVTVTTDGLTQLVFWQGVDRHLHEAWFTGAWNGPSDWTAAAFGGASPLLSSPTATVTTDGSTQIVFWTGGGGLMFEAWWAGGRWNGPVAVRAG
ncbi:MAG: CHAP domain-containing protein [Candidatus Dormibacteraeota bacterium]|nr:CHAP domain-containing protein [Candidatus Dormibacteraeota bacterium]